MKSLAVRHARVFVALVGVWVAVGSGYDPIVAVALMAISSTALALVVAAALSSPSSLTTAVASRRVGLDRRHPALGGHGIVAAPRRPRGP